MDMDAAVERLYERVDLVRGAGDRWRGQLCLMSLVALLAGEPHNDSPLTASPLIRSFGMVINDEMPMAMRQRLKPFAPRIIRTRDGRDRERAKLLADAWRMELVPRVLEDFGDQAGATDRRTEALLSCRLATTAAASAERLGWAVAKLIAHYARRAGYRRHDWYWLKSIDLLDRLSDVHSHKLPNHYAADRVRVANLVLDQSSRVSGPSGECCSARHRSFVPAGRS